jgi:hypothetical protein
MPGGCGRCLGGRQSDPGVLGTGDQAPAEPFGRSAAQPGAAHRRGGPAARRPATRAYAARRASEGKSTREIRRCLKRAIARQLFKLLERYDRPAVELIKVA